MKAYHEIVFIFETFQYQLYVEILDLLKTNYSHFSDQNIFLLWPETLAYLKNHLYFVMCYSHYI